MAKKAKVSTKRAGWTPTDEKTLKTRYPKEAQLKALAKDLGRTEGAIRQKAFSMGLGRASRAASAKKSAKKTKRAKKAEAA